MSASLAFISSQIGEHSLPFPVHSHGLDAIELNSSQTDRAHESQQDLWRCTDPDCDECFDCEVCNMIEKETLSRYWIFQWLLTLRDWETSVHGENHHQLTFSWGVERTDDKIKEVRHKLGILQTETVCNFDI